MARSRRRVWGADAFRELEPRVLMAVPVVDTVADLSVPLTKTRIVPITASDADGDALTYTVQSSSGAFTGRVIQGTIDLKLSVQGYGDLVFKLLPEFAPKTVDTIVGLVNSGYYNNLTFHRVISNFMIQGGDPKGDGSGGPGFSFDDEFNSDAIFSGYGQLAMANSGKDTNGSQFFITTSSPRWLDFEHTIFGQLVRGFDVLNAIKGAPTGANDRPTNPVVITSASITTNKTDTVLLIDSVSSGTSNFTVIAKDPDGNTGSRTFVASSAADTTNDPPILGPVTNVSTVVGQTVNLNLTSIDLENSAVIYDAAVTDAIPMATIQTNGTVIKVAPVAGYVGDVHVIVGVRQSVNPTRWDTQNVVITFKQQQITTQVANPSAVEGTSASKTIGSFTAAVPFTAANFTATVTWGSNAPVPATVVAGANGAYNVVANVNQARFGSYPYSFEVTDNATGTKASKSGVLTVTDAPLHLAFIPIAPSSGSRAISGALASVIDDNTAGKSSDLSATIDWGDGTTTPGIINMVSVGVFEVAGEKSYNTLGSFQVIVKVTSASGAESTTQGTIVVGNIQPVIEPIGSKSVNEGSTLSFTIGATDEDAGQKLLYELGSGAPAGAKLDPVTGLFTWTPESGPLTTNITVKVTDNGTPQLSTSRSFSVTVINVAPVVQVGPNGDIKQTETYTGSGTITDPGKGPWTATVDYGDGSGTQALAINPDRTFNLSHRYDAVGNFNAKVVVTDSGLPGIPVTKSFAVNVSNWAPTVSVGGAVSLIQFDGFQRNGSFSDIGPGNWTATVDYGDGTGRQALALGADRGFLLGRQYANPGNYTVSVVVTDQFEASTEASFPVNVAARPLVSFVSATSTIKKGVVSAITLTLDGDINPLLASNPGLYKLVAAGRDKKYGTKDDKFTSFKSATLIGRTVTLTPLKKLVLSGNYQLQISAMVDQFNRSLGRSTQGVVKASVVKKGAITLL